MDVKSDKKVEKHKSRHSNMMLRRMMSPLRLKIFNSVFGTVRLIFGLIVIFLIVYFVLAGGINQRKTVDSLKNMAMNVGQNIGNFFNSLFTSDSPLDISEEGIYIEGAEIPSDSPIDEKYETVTGDASKASIDLGEVENGTVPAETSSNDGSGDIVG